MGETKAALRARLVALLREPGGLLLSVAEAARRLGVHRTTARRLWEGARGEAERKLNDPIGPEEIADIERALLAKAREGGVMAARLLLMRRGLVAGPPVPDDGVKLVDEIKQLVERHEQGDSDGESAALEAADE
jgi:transposase-like protein